MFELLSFILGLGRIGSVEELFIETSRIILDFKAPPGISLLNITHPKVKKKDT